MAVGADLPIGSELLGYRVEAVLGRGGMGVVYLAEDLRLKRKVALKLLAPALAADERFRERLLAESELAASLDHPNIVPIYEAGEADGRIFISMRYVEGQDLKQRLRDGPLPPATALALVSQVAGALDAAHARGLVHRDVKPSNVLIAPRAGLDGADHVYLADFGLSRRLADEIPGEGRSLGTVDYVAPEQIRGGEVDGRADLYSLGCLLYECLRGRPPFDRVSDTEVLFAHLEDDPPVLPGLEAVIRRALAKPPDERFQSGRELVEAARASMGLERRTRARWPFAAAAGAVLVAAGLASILLSRGGGPTAEPGADSLVRIDPATNRVTKTMPVGTLAGALATDAHNVWVTSEGDGTVRRIDGKTQDTLEVPALGTPTAVAVHGGKVVVADGPQHRVVSLDAATGAVGFNAALNGSSNGKISLAAGAEGTWFADAQGGAGVVGRVDDVLSSGAPSEHVAIPTDRTSIVSEYVNFDALAVGPGAIWVSGDPQQRVVWRLDPRTQRVAATIPLSFVPAAIAAGEGAVWVTSLLGDTVTRIDPASNRITATIRVGRGPFAIAAGSGAVWVTNAIDGTVSRIDPAAKRVVATIQVGGTPRAVAVGAGGVWVSTFKPAPARPANAITIGVYADCQGPFGAEYNDSIAGAELPLVERGGKVGVAPTSGVFGVRVGSRPVLLSIGCDPTDGGSSTAQVLKEARRLVEQVGVDVLVAPTATIDELALQPYARTHPGTAFVDGAGAAPNPNPAPNYFTFVPNGVQWMAGLGSYAFHTLGWRRAVTVALAPDAFFWGQPSAFTAEFCSLGGTIVKRVWYPIYTSDWSSVASRIPRTGVDGILLDSPQALIALAKSDPRLRGNLSRKVILTSVAPSPTLYELGARAAGLVSAGPALQLPGADARPGLAPAAKYRTDFKKAFPGIPTLQIGFFDVPYYDAMAATLQALDEVRGDLSGGERRFMAALARVQLDAPNGHITLDSRHRAVGPNYIWKLEGPKLRPRVIRTIPRVDQSFGGYFKPTDPAPSTTTPACVKRTPPPWARSAS